MNFITTVTAASVMSDGQETELWSGGSDGIDAYNRNDVALPVLLDSGSTAWQVPSNYYNRYIAPQFPFVDRSGACSCEYASSGPSLQLEFAGKVTINVTADQFIIPVIDPQTREPIPYDRKGNNACVFLIQPDTTGAPFLVLGDAILRSMYVVYDLDNGQGSIAQANQNPGDSDVVTVEAGPTGVAAAVSGVKTAPANTNTPPPEVTRTVSFTVATAETAIATATGNAAIPEDAQISASLSSAAAPSATSSQGAANVLVPCVDFSSIWVASIWTAGIALGVGVMI